MILITGATGNLGSAVVKQLLKHASSSKFIATSSTAEGLIKLQKQGLEARLADFNDPTSLLKSFKGVDKLLLISTMEQNRLDQHKRVIDAAKEQGVKHIVYTGVSISDIESSGVKELMLSHFQTEDYLKQSGLLYTIVRNTIYAEALQQFLGPNAINQDINLPAGSGKVPFALRREMGEAIANLLVSENYQNRVFEMDGTQSYDFQDIANGISTLTGREIRYHDIPADQYIEGLKAMGLPEFAIYLHAGTIQDIKQGQYDSNAAVMSELLGRPSASLEVMLAEVLNGVDPLIKV